MDNLTVAELRDRLDGFDEGMRVVYENGNNPSDFFDSYRGYYDHVALEGVGESCEKEVTVGDLVVTCDFIVGSFVTGYKGGEFEIKKNTPVWASDYGKASGLEVTDVEERNGEVVLIVTPTEYNSVW